VGVRLSGACLVEADRVSLWGTVRQTGSFVAFVARNFTSFYAIVALTLVVLILEYAAASLMIPLASGGSTGNSQAVRLWGEVLNWLGMLPVTRSWLWIFFLVMIARLVAGYVQFVATTVLGKKVHKMLSGRIFAHIVASEPLKSVYTRSVGHYVTLAGDDTSRCGQIISNMLQCAVSLATAAVALAVLYQFSPESFSALGIFLSACAFVIAFLFRLILRLNARSTILSRELNTAFIEALNSLRSIRAFRAELLVSSSYAMQISSYVKMLLRIDAVKAAVKTFPAILLLAIASVLVGSAGGIGLSEATLLAVTIIIVRTFASMGQFLASGTLLLTDIRAVRDIRALLYDSSLPSTIEPIPAHIAVSSIALKKVDFGYDARSRILNAVSVTFTSGRSYAIVGPSGSGKSTMADVLLGLVKPDAGSVEVNEGRDLLESVRMRLLLVEQQPKIFSTSLRENLLFGQQVSDERLWDALRLVDLSETVRSMRNGLDTQLSYQGENFSGGQRQRIGIARALVRDPEVLVLDEATSALDSETRELVLRNVQAHMHRGILILITHDQRAAELVSEIVDMRSLGE
jgi:ABC-type bacteriocin/lantibiotic exporter with double-glycine peptidase domain